MSLPHCLPFPFPILFKDHSHKATLNEEVRPLLHLGVIKLVPSPYKEKFYSMYFLMLKKDKGLRTILDLRQLNKCIKSLKFRMVTLAVIIPALEAEDWFSVLDMHDVYFHAEIYPACRK